MLRTWRTGPKAALWCTFFLPASHPLLLFFLACPGKRAGGQDHHSLVQRRTIVFLKYNFILVPVGREDWCWQRVYLTNYRQVSIIKVGIAADHLSPLAALEAGPAEIAVVHNVPAVQTNTRIRSFCLMIAATASAGATGSTKHCDEDDVQAWWLVGWVAGWLGGWVDESSARGKVQYLLPASLRWAETRCGSGLQRRTVQSDLCVFQCRFWHSREQYCTARHLAHALVVACIWQRAHRCRARWSAVAS